MPPQRRASSKPANEVKVEPASASAPRVQKPANAPSQKEVEAAIEQSAEFLQQQAEPPSDVHPKPTTPSKTAVEAAVEQSAEFLESQGVAVDTSTSATTARDLAQDAAPVSAGGRDTALDAQPVSGARDKTQDASPVFSSPIPDAPRE